MWRLTLPSSISRPRRCRPNTRRLNRAEVISGAPPKPRSRHRLGCHALRVLAEFLSPRPLHALLRLNDAELLCDLEFPVLGVADVHIQPKVVLTGHHFGWSAGALRDLRVV